jgi:glycosyltransferase involved in cell wall biosynthesis
MRVAILTDYPVVCFANGPSLATQALKRHLEKRGHEVTIVGPRPGREAPLPVAGSLLLESVPFRAHPGVQLPFAWPPAAFDNRQRFDVIHSHANSSLMHWAPMMRRLHGIPCLSTNTVYIPGFAEYALPRGLCRIELIREFFSRVPARAIETSFAKTYDACDGLIVQCQGLADYWRAFGLRVPIHVIPRPIDAAVFDRPLGRDLFRPEFPRGKRIIVVCRHAREKDIDKVIEAFARHVHPLHPDASLTIVGDGQEHAKLMRLAKSLGVADRCDFPGEKPHKDLRDYYGHADLFAYASMTETYGQVISEALWCGVPVVALDDRMGVSFQVEHGRDGLLVAPGEGEIERLGHAFDRLLSNHIERATLAASASLRARARVAPNIVYGLYEEAYAAAFEHLARNPPRSFHGSSRPDWWGLLTDHLFPWTLQQSLLLAMGSLRGHGEEYVVPRVRIDGLPGEVPQARPLIEQPRTRSRRRRAA